MFSPNISYSMALRGFSVRERKREWNFWNSDSFLAETGPDLDWERTSSAVPSVK